MICSPRIGQTAQVWYRRELAAFMPLHGQIGTVEVVSRPPRVSGRKAPTNHGIRIDGAMYAVPCGNLRKWPADLRVREMPERTTTWEK